ISRSRTAIRICILTGTHAPLRLCGILFYQPTTPPELYTLSLHDALPICRRPSVARGPRRARPGAELRSRHAALPRRYPPVSPQRSEEHTSELQSRSDLVCRLLLEKKKLVTPLYVRTVAVSTRSRWSTPPI